MFFYKILGQNAKVTDFTHILRITFSDLTLFETQLRFDNPKLSVNLTANRRLRLKMSRFSHNLYPFAFCRDGSIPLFAFI